MNAFPEPPGWGPLVGSAGRLSVDLALAVYLLAAILWLLPAPRKLAAAAFWAATGLVLVALGAHLTLLLTRQYEFDYVWKETRNAMPWVYRLSAAWAAQEGSFLLWVVTSAVIASLAARSTGAYRRWYTIVCSLVLAAMLGIVSYESPFKALTLDADLLAALPRGQTMVLPTDGQGLNPTLQNYWMVIHPWVIFTGFGSLLALFGWGVSAAFSKDWQTWTRAIRPWAVFSATVLGVGLTMGGLWAYETLGWGGFWAWDPVENVSLVPFLASTVLIHTLYVQSNRSAWSRWNIVLASLPFVWFAYGTYLTRSGVLVNVSVHSFAKMNEGAHGLLMGLVIAASATALAVAGRAIFRRLPPADDAPSGHRTTGLALGMTAVYLVAGLAAVGMSLPFLAALFGFALPFGGEAAAKGVVPEDLYNRIIVWPFVPALALMGLAPYLGWTKTGSSTWSRVTALFFGSFFVVGCILVPIMTRTLQLSFWSMLAVMVAVWACVVSVVGNAMLGWERRKAGGLGTFAMHVGVSVLLLGLIVSHAFEKTGRAAITSRDAATLEAGPLRLMVAMKKAPTLDDLITPENTLDLLLVDTQGRRHLEMTPTIYYNGVSDSGQDPQVVMRPSILRMPWYDIYLSVTSRETTFFEGVSLKPDKPYVVPMGDGPPLKFTYIERIVEGNPGQPGSKFSLKMAVDYAGKRFVVTPQIVLAAAGEIEHRDSLVGNDFGVRLNALSAADGTATLSLLYPEPVYALELFFKPFTNLVWAGAGLMALGGLLTVLRLRKLAA